MRAEQLVASLKPWANAALGLFYPEVCQLCGLERATPAQGYVCQGCRARLKFIQPPFCGRCGLPFQGDITTEFECSNCRGAHLHFSWARSVVVAKEVALETIHRYKYARALWFEPLLADLLIRAVRPMCAEQAWDFIVPVPLHPTKERAREFNQAARLARRLGKAVGIPVDENAIRRVGATRTQTLLTREERRENVRGAFASVPGKRLDSKRILLVDDVFTTGATTNAAAEVLRRLGAADVCVWTVARGV